MSALHAELLPEEYSSSNKNEAPLFDASLLRVGDRVMHVDGGSELVVVHRYYAGLLNGERAVVQWLDDEGELNEHDFFAGNLRRMETR